MSGSGTGTPASAQSSATLNSLRDRIRVQVEAAAGQTEPLAVTASSIELNAGTLTLRDRVEARLQDSGNTRWSTADTDEAIRTSLEQYTRLNPHEAIGTVTLSANGREIDISSLTGLIRVQKVWWDYDSSSPGFPPNWRQFEMWPDSILYIDDRSEPQDGDKVRIWHTKNHTVKGLDAATATTVAADDIEIIVTGAAHFAARTRAIELSESLNVDRDVVKRLEDWADEEGKNFRFHTRGKLPAWQRRARAYEQEDIDEAIRWALHRYSEIKPDRAITTLTLSATGREIDISSITDDITIERVWWDYDSSAPENPPRWRNFELWPDDILYIKDPAEPQSADVVRLWYTRLQTINGLDGASTTTLDLDAETLIVTGATGYVAQERVQEDPARSIPRKLREWASARIREFERALKLLARREAARHSGIATTPALDRWDSEGSGWS